jgi:hypothetical protein
MKYFGLQNGGECFCDKVWEESEDYKKVENVECDVNGVGTGGEMKNAIYTTDIDNTASAYVYNHPTEMACRKWQVGAWEGPADGPEEFPATMEGFKACAEACGAGGSVYFGGECARDNKMYCKCATTLEGSIKVPTAQCGEMNDSVQPEGTTCTGPYRAGHYYLGGASASVYNVQPTLHAATPNPTPVPTPPTPPPTPWPYWKLIPGSTIALKNGKNVQKYCEDKGDQIECDSDAKATYVVVDAGNGKSALKGSKQNQYCADESTRVKCDREEQGDWTKFEVVSAGDGMVKIKGGKDGKWCSATDGFMKCNADTVSSTEKWQVECVSGGIRECPPTPAPTPMPTATPTSAPSGAPTKAPTATPTQAPSYSPTEAPTRAPTKHPTRNSPWKKVALTQCTGELADLATYGLLEAETACLRNSDCHAVSCIKDETYKCTMVAAATQVKSDGFDCYLRPEHTLITYTQPAIACKKGAEDKWKGQGPVANTQRGFFDCAKKCKYFKYFGLECPGATATCQCANTLAGSTGVLPTQCENGRGQPGGPEGEVSSSACVGPFKQGAFAMGSDGVSSVYYVSPPPPTHAPTRAPTDSPTRATKAPTAAPPTAAPIGDPTPVPTPPPTTPHPTPVPTMYVERRRWVRRRVDRRRRAVVESGAGELEDELQELLD